MFNFNCCKNETRSLVSNWFKDDKVWELSTFKKSSLNTNDMIAQEAGLPDFCPYEILLSTSQASQFVMWTWTAFWNILESLAFHPRARLSVQNGSWDEFKIFNFLAFFSRHLGVSRLTDLILAGNSKSISSVGTSSWRVRKPNEKRLPRITFYGESEVQESKPDDLLLSSNLN